MKTLAIDLSSPSASLAWLDGQTKREWQWPNDRQQSGVFFQTLSNVHRESGLPDRIIVGLGPGSYAGTRIAISAATGLGKTAKIPDSALLGYPSIAAMRSESPDYYVVGDARRQSFFLAQVRSHRVLEGPSLLSESELRDRIAMIQPGVSIFSMQALPQFERIDVCSPSALILAQLAERSAIDFDTPPLQPIYLREPHITVPRRGSPVADERKAR